MEGKKIKKYIPKPGRREIFTIALLVMEILIFSIVAQNFLNPRNLETVLRNATDLAVVSIGMTMVMIIGGIDISVGSSLGVVAIVVGWLLQAEVNPILIGLVAISIGTAIGMINGILISWLRIPDIIATLGTSNILRAAIFAMLGGRWLTGLNPVYSVLTRGKFGGVPISVIILLVLYGIFWYFLTYRPLGRHIYAVGNSPEASTLAGINARKTRISAYAILGGLVGFASLLYVGRLGSVEMTVGTDLAISAIAAVVIGGTSVTAGRGSVVGTLAGVLFMAVLKNGVVLLGIPSLWERAVVGLIIILSVSVDILIGIQNERRQREQIAQQRKVKAAVLG